MSTSDLVKIIIFSLLQIPYMFFIGWGVVPVLILILGFFLARRDQKISTLKASIMWCKYYLYLTAVIICLCALYVVFIEHSYAPSEIFQYVIVPLVAFLLLPISYFLFLEHLYSRPIQNNPSTFLGSRKRDELSILRTENMKSYSVADELLKWKELKDQGLITEKEFNEMKKKIIGS
ncbi:SHOCT domain-containing protein [Acinetobacter seifertii]|uniref:SHOCT domain-containing protein n=1 Tax=Acinetobacter seifertii TaxID=1530123 RepID=UPI0040421981